MILNQFRVLSILVLGSTLLSTTVSAADRTSYRDFETYRAQIESLKLSSPVTHQLEGDPRLHPSLRGAVGQQTVIVRLNGEAVGAQLGETEALTGEFLNGKSALMSQQAGFIARCQAAAPSLRVIARTQLVLNAVFVEVDASELSLIAQDPAVARVAPVADYELHLSETVPYIGAAAAQKDGAKGKGVSVAVLDSGIDYTHKNLGGKGTLEAYEAAYGVDNADPANTTRDGLFPTRRVVDGYDFVGEAWPNGDLAPDPDPIDFEGHGTHVADIIGGKGGVAPKSDLVAVKVCSAVSSSCSGIALIQGMEFAVDPNGDGDPEDGVDIINMSLGSDYGQPFDDDLSLAVENATKLGVLTVSSAGNGGDKPYKVGTPSAAPTALSVAQTQVPSAALQVIDVAGNDLPAVFQPWSAPLTDVITGPAQYADGAGGNLEGCDPFAAGSLTGLVVLVDRGSCNFTLKIKNIADAGGVLGIIGLVAPGAPFSGGDGGDRPITAPGFMISQADADDFKANVGATVTVDPANGIPLVGQMVGSSSRGPSNFYNALKPEIGAPGASVSAEAGTGTGETPFGGTSGASPMVAGAAALIIDKFKIKRKGKLKFDYLYGYYRAPGRNKVLKPRQVKAILMNNSETDIATDPFSGLAPITRIGGGEVRVDQALDANVILRHRQSGGISFGFHDVAGTKKVTRRIVVENPTNKRRTYSITPSFRYQNDVDLGAIDVQVRDYVTVPARSKKTIPVRMTIDGEKLLANAMNSGSEGANPEVLTLNEIDGYLEFRDGQRASRMPWQVLPRKAARVRPFSDTFPAGGGTIDMLNTGVGAAQIDAYSLIAVSDDIPRGPQGGQAPTPDIRALGVTTIPVPAGFCSADESFLWAFASTTHERQTYSLPVSMQWALDTDQDGVDDYIVLNRDVSLTGVSDGRQLTFVVDLATGDAGAFFFAEHSTNTANMVNLICAEQIGMNANNFFQNVNVSVLAQDFYFGGPSDEVTGLTIAPLGEQYLGLPSDIPGNASGSMDVLDFGALPGNTAELGLLVFTNGDRGAGNRGGATKNTEALLFEVEEEVAPE